MTQLMFPILPDGLIVDVLVSTDGDELVRRLTSGESIPRPVWCKGVLDTGSNVSGVANSILQQLAIPRQQQSSTQGIGGSLPVGIYKVSLSITNRTTPGSPLFTPPVLQVMDLTVPEVEVLIGRDLLNLLKLTADGPGGWFSLEW